MTDKFQKNTSCGYCGSELLAKYRNKRFCSSKCRVYFSREKNNEPKIVFQKATPESYDAPKTTNRITLDEVGQYQESKQALSTYEVSTAKERIKQLEYEIANPGNPVIGKRSYIAIRETELKELKTKLNEI